MNIFDFSPLVAAGVPVRGVGLDLGTTNSTAAEALWDPSRPDEVEIRCLDIDQDTELGRYTSTLMPSVVVVQNGRPLVGEGAKRLRAQQSARGLAEERDVFANTKNVIGTSRTFPRAPEGYRTPRDIAGHILTALAVGANLDANSSDSLVVTVPASFQAAQRADTRAAAEMAKLGLQDGALLDEPVAALLDWVSDADDTIIGPEPKNVLVFDFGGGTCDVAILSVARQPTGILTVAPRSVSRYHRLGGSDIDEAIVHEELIPQLIAENNLGEFDLEYEERKIIGASLIGLAEALKIGLCEQISRLQSFGKYSDGARAELVKTQPGVSQVVVNGRTLTLTKAKLKAVRFEELLEPFLDIDMLYARSTEYRLTCSIFAPLGDALERSGLEPDDIEFALFVGGSSRIPQLIQKLTAYLPRARVLPLSDPERRQTAIARGAALQALAFASTGRGLIKAIAHDSISIRTQNGSKELIALGAQLPITRTGKNAIGLTAPAASEDDPVEIRIELFAGGESESRVIFSEAWELPGPVSLGEPLALAFTIDADQVLSLTLSRVEPGRSLPFEGRVENPLTNVVNPNAIEQEIEGIETELRSDRLTATEKLSFIKLAVEKYSELGQIDKAIAFAQRLLRVRGSDYVMLDILAELRARRGEHEASARLAREAARAGFPGAMFNLALRLEARREFTDARQAVEEAILLEDDPCYEVLKAKIMRSLGDMQAADVVLAKALSSFTTLPSQSDWSLGWCLAGHRMAGDTKRQSEVEAERKRRKRDTATAAPTGRLPGESA